MTGALSPGETADARLIFRAGGRRYALPAARIREITRLPRLTSVPLAPPGLLGLGHVRGETLAVITPLARDGETAPVLPRQLLVLEGGDRIGLAVDAVERVERRDADDTDDAAVADLPLKTLIEQSRSRRSAAGRLHRIRTTWAVHETAGDHPLALLRVAIGDQSFALPLDEIAQVLRVPADIARLPGADPAVVGTIGWQDRTIGILSLATLLGLTEADGGHKSRIIILSLGAHWLGLYVPHIEGLLHITSDRIDRVPATLLRKEGEARIRAICRSPDGSKLVSILAADHLLSEARTRRLLAGASQRKQASPAAHRSTARLSFLAVWVGPHRIALPLTMIEAVRIWPVRCTSVPATPSWFRGLATIGNRPLAIIDQTARLTGSPASGGRQRLLVVQTGGQRLGFLVDGVEAIVKAEQAALTPAPLPEALADGIFGDAMQLADGDASATLLVVEPEVLISSTERAFLAETFSGRSSAET